MIQIITGTFGYYDGRKVIPLTNESGPKQLDPELEARLVKKGIAKYVGNEHAQNENTHAQAENDAIHVLNVMPGYNEGMKLEELKSIAAEYGVDASAMRKKADVIAAIEAAKEEYVEDDEEPPRFDVEDPV
ncbi:MAG: Rho termination factor N-terminal domain-containing protein [Oscillospiraceae bacterium]|nr:Rho termination factor N-terminal domain-containing protein [Oscillospiraceae bacterium]